MEITVEQHLDCPPERAFDRLADARNETAWNDKVTRSELKSAEPIGAGSEFVTVNRGREYVATISTYERPSRLAFDVRGPMNVTTAFAFTLDGAGTRLSGTFDFRPTGAMRLLFPLLKPAIRRDIGKQMESIKRFCETA